MRNKMLVAMVVSGAALLGVVAKAGPLAGPPAGPIPTLASPQVQAVDWGYWHHPGWWHRHEAWRDWHRHERWARWHYWHDRYYR